DSTALPELAREEARITSEEAWLIRPQTEVTRQYYEALIMRGVSLLQPHTVLWAAEAYHAWYHSSPVDVAGSILYKTLGQHGGLADRGSDDASDDGYDIRSVYWLALCYWHIGEMSTVYALLGPIALETEDIIERCDSEPELGLDCSLQHGAGESSKLRSKKALVCGLWLLAMSCTRLEKWQEAEDHLETLSGILRLMYLPDELGNSSGADIKMAVRRDGSLYAVPTQSDVSDLLGMVCMRTNRVAQSEAHSLDTLRRNQLQWSACRRLCDLGNATALSRALALDLDRVVPDRSVVPDRIASERTAQRQPTAERTPAPVHRLTMGISTQLRQAGRVGPAEVPGSSARARTRTAASSSGASSLARAMLGQRSGNASGAETSGAARPLASKTPARSEAPIGSDKKRTRNGAAVRTPAAAVITKSADRLAQTHMDRSALAHVHGLVLRSAAALVNIDGFAKLAAAQQNSAWGLCVLGRLCFEAGQLPEAAQAFGAAHSLAPYRVRDMDIYSTVLWHMKRSEALAQLAHTLVAAARAWSPEAWVAVANCFSLDGDHAAALRSLTRGIQLHRAPCMPRSDSGGATGLAYTHALVGHESVACDDLDRAQLAFRTALRTDARHYNAWYGLGTVYLRLSNFDLAEYHFNRALALNPHNPLLLQSAASLLEARADYPRALAVYDRVERMLTPAHHAANFVAFKRARLLVVLEHYAAAAAVLEFLLPRCPREFNVPFLLGQTYAKLHRFREAAACLTKALDIAPENAHSVREAFDALYLEDSEDVEESPDSSNLTDSFSMSTSLAAAAAMPNLLSPSSPTTAESPYFESPSIYAARRGRAEWSRDWQSLNSADDRVARAFDFDI
ncbi:anaphase-promoting complex subunit cdc27, partial [Coemansia sp. RSA 2322]